MTRAGALLLAIAAVAAATLGCGSRTGLEVADAGVVGPPEDAGVDASIDAAVPLTCIEVPPGPMPRITAELSLPVMLAVVDVLFLMDASASMLDEIDNVRDGLVDRVVPGVRARIPDAAFGAALTGEFPIEPHGPDDVRPYALRSLLTTDVVALQGALSDLPSWGNFDLAESQVEGLYQVATGEGLEPWIMPSFGCPGGGEGGACFRSDSLPVILLITDAPMHNGPDGANPYRFEPAPHDYDAALAALTDLGALVIGLGARDFGTPSPMPHLDRVARDTGAVDETGRPLAFDIGPSGREVGDGVVRAIERLAEGVPLDVDAVVQDVAGDAIDARQLVSRVSALSAVPSDGVMAIEDGRFVGARPGTLVRFELEIDASAVERPRTTTRVRATVIFRAFERSHLGRVDVIIVLVGEDGGGCEDIEAG